MATSAKDAPRRRWWGLEDAFAALVDDPFQDGSLTGEAVNRSAIAVAQIDLATLRVVAVSDAAAAPCRARTAGIWWAGWSGTSSRARPTGGLPLLATGRLEGFEAPRRIRRADGTVVSTYVWAHVLGLARPARYGAAFLVDAAPTQPSLLLASPGSDQKIIGTVDAGVADRPDQP